MFSAYERNGVATIKKVDPPTLTLGGGRRTVLLENPWLDFAGTWTARGGRSIIIEAKHTEKPILPINRKGGITPKQWENLLMWKRAGAAVFIAWEYKRDIRVSTPELISGFLDQSQRKSMPWFACCQVDKGTGFITHDILKTCDHLTFDR